MRKLILILTFIVSLYSYSQVPVIESFTSNSSVTADLAITFTKPGSVAVDDLLMVIIGNDDTAGANEFAAPAGWIKIGEPGSGVSDAHVAVFYRLADGTEGATQEFTSNSADFLWGYYIRISSVDTSSPLDVTGSFYNNGSSASHVVTEITTTSVNCLAFTVLAFDGGDGLPFVWSGTGWTKEGEIYGGGTGSAGASGTWGTKEMPSTGATGDVTITSNVTDGAAGMQFAIVGSISNTRNRAIIINK